MGEEEKTIRLPTGLIFWIPLESGELISLNCFHPAT